MRPAIIEQSAAQLRLKPNWEDSPEARAAFSWPAQAEELAGMPSDALNLAYEAIDKHAHGRRRRHVARRILDTSGGHCSITYAQLSSLSNLTSVCTVFCRCILMYIKSRLPLVRLHQ